MRKLRAALGPKAVSIKLTRLLAVLTSSRRTLFAGLGIAMTSLTYRRMRSR